MREEVLQWYQTQGKPPHPDIVLRSQVQQNVDHVVRRAELMACKLERDTVRWYDSSKAMKPILITFALQQPGSEKPDHFSYFGG